MSALRSRGVGQAWDGVISRKSEPQRVWTEAVTEPLPMLGTKDRKMNKVPEGAGRETWTEVCAPLLPSPPLSIPVLIQGAEGAREDTPPSPIQRGSQRFRKGLTWFGFSVWFLVPGPALGNAEDPARSWVWPRFWGSTVAVDPGLSPKTVSLFG